MNAIIKLNDVQNNVQTEERMKEDIEIKEKNYKYNNGDYYKMQGQYK